MHDCGACNHALLHCSVCGCVYCTKCSTEWGLSKFVMKGPMGLPEAVLNWEAGPVTYVRDSTTAEDFKMGVAGCEHK